jgi:hypothetical protein
MSFATPSQSAQSRQAVSRRPPLTYPQALERARQLVIQEANERGSELSDEAMELAAAKKAAQIFRQSI